MKSQWKYIQNYLKQPHPGYWDLRVYFKVCISIALLIFLILVILKPYNFSNPTLVKDVFATAFYYAGAGLLTMTINSLWIVFFPHWFSERKWNIGREMGILMYQFFTIGIAILLVSWLRNVSPIDIASFLRSLFFASSSGIIAYGITTILRHNYLLKKHLKESQQINEQLLINREKSPVEADKSPENTIVFADKNVILKDFYYAESKGNYLEIVCLRDGEKYTFLERLTMKELEQQTQSFPEMVRCHRSFMVNIEKVLKSEGNANGYLLYLSAQLPQIPVSRSYISSVRKRILDR